MKTALSLLVLPIAVLLAGDVVPSAAQAVTPSADANAPAIVTVGDGVVRRAPDRAFVDVTTETRAKTPRDAQAQNADLMGNVQQKLRGANLPKDAVRTIRYGVEPEFDYVNGRTVLRGYVARNSIEIKLDDLNRVGEIVDLVTTAGATSVGGVRFDLKDREAAEREALGMAVANAKAKAEVAATAAGRTVQAIWRIVEETTPRPGPQPMYGRVMAAGAAPTPTPIEAGDIEIHARVSLTVLIK